MVSISLVLFTLGILGIIILNARQLSNYVKENIELSIILDDKAKEADIIQLQKKLDAAAYTKSTEYVTKEEAAEDLQKELGEDFVSFLGYNPLFPSLDVRLHADYANSDSLEFIEKNLSESKIVKEIHYQRSLIDMINENIKMLSIILLVFTGLLFLVAVALINNTIRLSLYSKRFLIKTMQLVGATRSFVRRPFVFKGMANGFYGGLIAVCLLAAMLYVSSIKIPELFAIQQLELIAILFGIIILVGIFISWISTIFAVNKYLRLKVDDLY